MRILVVTSEAPPIVSGVSRCVERLVDGLRARGHEVDVISSVTMKRLVIGEFRFSSFIAHWPGIARRLASYDVINLHGPAPTLSDAFLFLARLRRKTKRRPIVYTHHSAVEIAGWEAASDLYNVMHKWLSKTADVTLTTSQFYRDSLFSPTHPLARIVPWGVEHFDTTAHVGSPGGPLRVLFVGQMRPYKGVRVLLDAVNGQPELDVTLIGSGPDLPHHLEAVKKRGQTNAAFVGSVTNEELEAAYHDADVVVLPSLTRAEAFGLVVLEGMASGAVPVVSDLPGVRDLAEGPGIIVAPGNVEELREALISLAADRDQLARRHRQALDKAQSLSWDACVDAYESVMRELVEPHSLSPVTLIDANHQATPQLSIPVAPAKRRASAFSGAARRWVALLTTLPLILAGCQQTGEPDPSPGMAVPGTNPPAIGTLMSAPERNESEREAGVSAAMVELEWRRAEPVGGEFNHKYLESAARDIRLFRESGRAVTLGLGLHYSPDWLFQIPDSRFIDQHGEVADQLNLVFNTEVRDAAARYLEAIDQSIGFENIDGVRLTAGGSSEVLYPGGGSYFAFDANAQGGAGLPATMAPNPAPGWRPGTPIDDASAVTEWANWYISGLVDVVEWQRRLLRELGFSGDEQVLTPGLGILPGQFDRIVAAGLPDGLLGLGASWDRVLGSLEPGPGLVAYSTSVADTSGADSGCQESDRELSIADVDGQGWSAVRWITWIAGEYGLRLAGENPGYGQPPRLNESYVDESQDGMMATAFRLVEECDLDAFYWAHDHDLWDGTASAEQFLRLTRAITSRPGEGT